MAKMPPGRRHRSSRRRAAASGGGDVPLGQEVLPVRPVPAGARDGGEGPLGQELLGRSGLAGTSGGGDGRSGSEAAAGGGEGPVRQKGSTLIRPGLDSSGPINELSDAALTPLSGRERKRKRKRGMVVTTSPLKRVRTSKATAEVENSDSSCSSPLHRPKSLLVKETVNGKVVYRTISDQDVVAAYNKDNLRYQKKLARLQELPTLKPCKYFPNITEWCDLSQKKAAVDVARSVVTLSSYDGDKQINRCSGVMIDWVEVDKSAIVVTASEIICTKISLDDWEDNSVYAPNAKVIAHLADGTTSELSLLFFSKHYDLAYFKITSESSLKVLALEEKLDSGHEAFMLARDEDFGMFCRHTRVQPLDPLGHQKNHWLFINGQIPQCCTGGALANFNKNLIGMLLSALPNAAFIPSSIILNCLRLWKRFGHLARPHLGLKLKNMDFMDISYLEHLSHVFNISSGLIVAKVAAESPAERNGIRLGDVILSCQGLSVSSISQFEGILLNVCEKQYEISDHWNSKVDIELIVYNLRKNARKTVTLSVKLSECMEVFT